MTLQDILNFEPHFEGISSKEPSIHEIIFIYYKKWFGSDMAKQYTEEYIRKLTEEIKLNKDIER